MNHIPHRVALFTHLMPHSDVLIRVIALLATTVPASTSGSPGGAWTAAVVIWLMFAKPDRDTYRSLGLSHRLWKRHRRILLTLLAAMVLLLSVVAWAVAPMEPRPVFAVVVIVAWLIAMLWPVKPHPRLKPRLNVEELASESAKVPRLSMSPTIQIIRLPQISAWVIISVLLAVITGLFLFLNRLINFSGGIASVAAAVTSAVALVFFLETVSRSLRNWVAIGGSRTAWAKEAALIGLFIPVLAVLGLGGARDIS